MLKSVIKILLNIVLVIILFLLQLYTFNNLYIFGGRVNIVAVYCIIVAMISPLKVSIPTSLVLGILTDILLGKGKIEYLAVFTIVTIVLECLKQTYKQDSSMSVAIYTIAGLTLFQIITVIFSLINNNLNIGLFEYVFFVVKTIILNIPAAYLTYFLYLKINDKTER